MSHAVIYAEDAKEGGTMAVQQRATLADVARLAGVSQKTASRVFNQRELVSEDTVERVLDASTRLKFRPNTMARNLRAGGATKTLGLIVGELGNPFYYKVAAGLEKELSRHGYALVVASTDDSASGEARVADALLGQRIDALLIIPVADDQSYLEGERQLGTPIIAIDRPASNLVADSVVLDNRRGAYVATRHLTNQGHRRIAYVCNPAGVYSQAERLAGYRRAMAEAGVADTSAYEALEDDRAVTPERMIRALLTSEAPPTAIVAGNNRVTVGALRVLKELGDTATALIGVDDFDTADVIGVTVVSYDPTELGRAAAEVALERMRNPTATPRQIVHPTWLVERGTGERPPKDTP